MTWSCINILSVTNNKLHEIKVLLGKLLVKKLNAKALHFAYKIKQLNPNLGQTTPVHNFQSYFLKIRFNIILLTKPRSSMQSLSFMLSNQERPCLNFSSHLTCPAHLILLGFIQNISKKQSCPTAFHKCMDARRGMDPLSLNLSTGQT